MDPITIYRFAAGFWLGMSVLLLAGSLLATATLDIRRDFFGPALAALVIIAAFAVVLAFVITGRIV